MKLMLATTMLASLLAFPALAQMSSDDMSCADFAAMDSSGQMKALESMTGGMASDAMSSEGAMKSGGMASDAMKSGDAMQSGAMKSGKMASGDAMKPSAKDVAKACTDHPDMMVHDAMEQAMMAH